jgi:glycosyltransferase involved in cell wall biosynthesis
MCYTEPRFSAALDTMDIVWGTNYTLPDIGRSSCKRILTVHDMAWTRYPDAIQAPMLRILSGLAEHVESADRVLVVSEATKQDLIRHCRVDSRKVRVIYNGVSERFRPLTESLDSVRLRYNLPERFVLFVGTVEPRKNLARLVEAFDRVGRKIEHSLVVVGAKGWKTSPIYREISRSPLRDRIHVAGFVADGDLPAVYNLADAFVYPSLYEGFGIPVVEAMACGIPVVTSDVSALPEVAGDAALLVDPFDSGALAEALERIVHDEPLRDSLRSKGIERARRFSWDTSAAHVIQCFRELYA